MEKLYHPVIFDEPDNKELIKFSSQKSFEERMYFVIFSDNVDGLNIFERFDGRTACYRGIERLLKTYEYVDPKDMIVLVEVIGKDRKTGEYKWFIMHPDDPGCKNAYEFCKSVEEQFGNTAFDIDEYTDDRPGEEDAVEVKTEDVSDTNTIQPNLFDGSAEVANAYAAISQERANQTFDLFAAPKENPFNAEKI